MEEDGAAFALAVEVAAELVEVEPDFGIGGGVAGFEDAHDFPQAAAEAYLVAQAGGGVAAGDGLADDDLCQAGLEHLPWVRF